MKKLNNYNIKDQKSTKKVGKSPPTITGKNRSQSPTVKKKAVGAAETPSKSY